MAENENTKAKKQVPLRLSASLYDELARWAEDDFRSINGQIEYLLTECVNKRRKSKSKLVFQMTAEELANFHKCCDDVRKNIKTAEGIAPAECK